MKKKLLSIVMICASVGGIFLLSRVTPEENTPEKLILNEYSLEPYLNIRGWEVTELSVDTVRIPQTFEGSYKTFAEEMKKSGFDLESHKGDCVTRYTYSVDNYGEDYIHAELLLTQENELISAALIQCRPDGFIKPLS